MDELTKLANKYESDKGTISPSVGHHGPRLHFTPKYSKYFEDIKNDKLNILEIGVGSGPSLKMWYEYFPNSTIHAIDVVSQTQHENDRVKTHICDQSKREELEKTMEKIGQVDIIFDDGSHVISHQQISLGFLFKYLKKGGQYWVEDLHTSDAEVWQGKNLYGYDMSFNMGEDTVSVLENFIDSKIFNSPFLDELENNFLTENVKECEMFELPKTIWGVNKLCLLKK
jgi:hypothetical protein